MSAKTSQFMNFVCMLPQTPWTSSAESLEYLSILSCIVQTEQTEGTEVLQISLPWVTEFLSGQVQRQFKRTGIHAPARLVGVAVSNTLTQSAYLWYIAIKVPWEGMPLFIISCKLLPDYDRSYREKEKLQESIFLWNLEWEGTGNICTEQILPRTVHLCKTLMLNQVEL